MKDGNPLTWAPWLSRVLLLMAKKALLFVSDMTGLVAFAKALVERHGYVLFGSDGVVDVLGSEGLSVSGVAPAAVLSDAWLAKEGVDLVVADFYPFERASQDVFAAPESVMQQIDIKAPCLLRSAGKRGHEVTVICEPSDYARVDEALRDERKLRSLRSELAAKVFQKTAQYDLAIATFLENRSEEPDLGVLSGFSRHYRLDLEQAARLLHGENPHQQAALYGGFFDCLKPLQGGPLTYRHSLEVSAAVYLIGEFEKAAVAIIKHNSPCGVASADALEDAWSQALETDAVGASGGVVIVNRTLDGCLAENMKSVPLEVIVAPHFTEEALGVFSKNKNLRLLVVQDMLGAESLKEVRSAIGGVLVQDRDKTRPSPAQWNVVSICQPSADAWVGLTFGWRVVKHVKSSATVIACGERTLKITSGNTTGAGGLEAACLIANNAGRSLEGAVLVSDSVLETPDIVGVVAKMGISAILLPGGGPSDAAVIRAADEAGIAMIFSGTRHLKY